MNRFDDLYQRVSLLNSQLDPVRHLVGSEVRRLLYEKLWRLVGELNSMLNLGLDNTALDLTADRDRLVIHYWSGTGGSVENEVNLFIDRSFAVEKQTRPKIDPMALEHDITVPRPLKIIKKRGVSSCAS